VGLAKSADRRGTEVAGTWLNAATHRLQTLPLATRLRHASWALTATVATFVLAAPHRSADPTALVVFAAGVLVLSATAMSVRAVVARRAGIGVTQWSWLPGIFFGLAAGAAGFPWAPLPVAGTHEEDGSARVHLSAPVTLAVVSLLLFLEFAWIH
jgi:cellulose synthase operon protein C